MENMFVIKRESEMHGEAYLDKYAEFNGKAFAYAMPLKLAEIIRESCFSWEDKFVLEEVKGIERTKRDMFKTTVTYKGYDFEVEYSWEDAYLGDFYEPDNAGGVDEYFIYLGNGIDVTEMLTENTVDEIIYLVEKDHREGFCG